MLGQLLYPTLPYPTSPTSMRYQGTRVPRVPRVPAGVISGKICGGFDIFFDWLLHRPYELIDDLTPGFDIQDAQTYAMHTGVSSTATLWHLVGVVGLKLDITV